MQLVEQLTFSDDLDDLLCKTVAKVAAAVHIFISARFFIERFFGGKCAVVCMLVTP